MKELELSLIGSIIQDPSLYLEHKEYFNNLGIFQSAENQSIAEYVIDQIEEHGKCSLAAAMAKFRDQKNIISNAAKLADKHGFQSNIVGLYHDFKQAKYIEIYHEAATSILSGDDPDECRVNAESKILEVTGHTSAKYATWTKVITTTIDNILAAKNTNGLTGIDTGFSKLNEQTGGFQKTDIIIVAARPGMGKTTYALQLAQDVAKYNKGYVLFFSLEMSKEQLVQRLISMETGISVSKMRNGDLSEYEANEVLQVAPIIHSYKIVIIDECFKLSDIKAACLTLKHKIDVDLIIIDYLQLIDSEVRGGSTNDKVAKISREISILASSSYMNCPVIPLSQLNRNVESRADKRPTLSDLRDSGSLEQDATGVIFIYRPSVYDTESIEDNELIMAKNRHGGLTTDYFDFKYPFTRFTKTSSAVIEQPVYDNVDFKQFRKTVKDDQIDF